VLELSAKKTIIGQKSQKNNFFAKILPFPLKKNVYCDQMKLFRTISTPAACSLFASRGISITRIDMGENYGSRY
jgi:hypothetical protein